MTVSKSTSQFDNDRRTMPSAAPCSADPCAADSPLARDGKPATVIVVHPRERRAKCSVEPLRQHSDFRFFTFPNEVTIDLSNYVQLGLGGPVLSEDDADRGLLLLDGTWRLALRMAPFYRHIPVRSLPIIHTAYPRRSSVFDDPGEGLATIEALFAGLKILGRNTKGLLDHYYWRDRFLDINGWSEKQNGVSEL